MRGIYSPEDFSAILEGERLRADRNRKRFSLVLFEVGKTDGKNASYKHLEHVITRRKRFTDEIGWLDRRRIGILLPETGVEGARKFAGELREAIADTTPPPAFTVYTYPSQFSPGDISHPGEPTTTTRTQSGERPVEGLEQLFIRGMPTWKRGMDIVGSLLGLILLSPLFLVVAIVIKIVSPGPVLYKQERQGYQGKNFTMLKFRTMKVNADNSIHQQHVRKLIKGDPNDGTDKPMTKLDNDPQIIPFGKIIRKSCIDELPQLINVFRGEMSLVGPRPDVPYAVGEYYNWFLKRHDIIPGMTGLWQVSGKNRLAYKEMIRLDIQYAKKCSFWLDIKILLQTIPAILSQIKDSLLDKKFKN